MAMPIMDEPRRIPYAVDTTSSTSLGSSNHDSRLVVFGFVGGRWRRQRIPKPHGLDRNPRRWTLSRLRHRITPVTMICYAAQGDALLQYLYPNQHHPSTRKTTKTRSNCSFLGTIHPGHEHQLPTLLSFATISAFPACIPSTV
jgi:hypothetical protein